MANNNETTTRFKADISELKRAMQEAQRQVRLANSEFQAVAAGMDNWQDSADGVSAKVRSLESVLSAQNDKLQLLSRQYALTAQEMGADSRAAQELQIQINNQRAAIARTRSELETYTDMLSEMNSDMNQSVSAYDRLNNTISEQRSELQRLQREYANYQVEGRGASDEAQELARRISDLSGELSNNERQLREADEAAGNLGDSTEEAAESAENAGDGFTVLKGALADLVADGISWAIDKFKELMVSSDQALNTLQTRTGMTTEEMSKFKGEMNDLYKNNYGESLNDIAESMAAVASSSKETDPTKIKELTKNALVLRDTFDFEVNESMRAVNMLMDQFGVTGEEAFNLIVQGAQNGLDKNGDLLDSINEYGVHYKQMGYTAEEFFNSLKNGTDAGTFSVDKLGDAVKEFGIRAKDGSEGTADAFKLIGVAAGDNTEAIEKAQDKLSNYNKKISDLESKLKYAQIQQSGFNDKTSELTKVKVADNIKKWTDELSNYRSEASHYEEAIATMTTSAENSGQSVGDLFARFAAGGDEAKSATDEVLAALFAMDDKVQQDAAGVALFGTMWEDLGKDGVAALMNMNGEMDRTNESMKEIDAIKYDDVGSQLATLGRTIETDLIQPLVEKLQPKLDEAITWAQENLPAIVEKINEVGSAISGTIDFLKEISPLLVALGTAIAGLAILGLIQNLGAIGLALKTWAASTKLVTAAQWLLNAAMSANPIGLIVVAIAALVAAFVVLWNKSEKFREFWIGLWEKIKEAASAAGEWIKNAFDEVIEFFTVTVPKVFNDVIEFFKNNWQALLLMLVNPFVGGFKLLYDNCEGFREFIDGFVQKIKDFFTNAWDEIVEFFTTDIPDFIDKVIEWFNNLPENIGFLIGQAIGHVAKFGVDLFNFAKTEIPKFIDKVIEFFKTLPGKTWDWLKQTWDKIKTWGQEIVKTGKENASYFIAAVINFIKELPIKVWTWLLSTITKVKDWGTETVKTGKEKASEFVTSAITFFKEMPGKAYNAIKETINKVIQWGKDLVSEGKEAGSNLVKTVSDEVSSLPGKMLTIGGDLVKGLWNGISDMGSWIKEKISGFGSNIIEGFKSVFDINSPSKIMEKLIGNNIVYGFVKGITDKTKDAVSAVSDLADKSMIPLNDVKADIAGNIGNISGSIKANNANVAAAQSGTVNNYNFVQNNSSPKALSRLEIYRQTRNQLNFAKGV